MNGTHKYVANCVQQAENAISQELSMPPSMGLLSVPSVHGHVVGIFKEAVMVHFKVQSWTPLTFIVQIKFNWQHTSYFMKFLATSTLHINDFSLTFSSTPQTRG